MYPPHLKGHLQIAAAATLFGLIGIFVKLTTQMPLGSIIFYRLLFGLIAIAIFFGCCGRLSELRLRDKKGYILLLGLFQAGTMFSYFFSVKYTSVSIAVLLLYTAPVYVTLLSPLILKEHVTRSSLLALGISSAGVFMVIQPGNLFQGVNSMYIIGLAAGLVSGLCYASIIITSRYLREYYSGTAQAAWALFITMVIFSPYAVAIPGRVVLDNLSVLVLFGLLPTAVALIFYLNGLMRVRAQSASIIALLEPVSAVVFAFIILSEPVTYATIMGGGLILVGAVLVSREWGVESSH
ncbi:MAG: EamA family transporter [Methanosarcinales archaeon]|nr:EamA family transporter [Methanosarcinales archaeon]